MKKTPRGPGTPTRLPPGLSPDEIRSYYEILATDITAYDCGTLCAPLNDGVPFCCSAKLTLPLLYRSELAFLQQLGDFWSEWNPGTARSRRLRRQLSREEVYCQCRGAAHCIREQRSLSCRTFPLEPYIDERGGLVGLVFISGSTSDQVGTGLKRCPLTDRAEEIRPEFVDRCFAFWQILLRIPVEYDTYRAASRSLRKSNAKRGVNTLILFPTRREARSQEEESIAAHASRRTQDGGQPQSK